MLNIASGSRATIELASRAGAPGAERIEDVFRALVMAVTVRRKRLGYKSQSAPETMSRF